MTGYHTKARVQPTFPHATAFYKPTLLDQSSWCLSHLFIHNTDILYSVNLMQKTHKASNHCTTVMTKLHKILEACKPGITTQVTHAGKQTNSNIRKWCKGTVALIHLWDNFLG